MTSRGWSARACLGCDGASISLLADDGPSTWPPHDRIWTLDEAQYSRQFGPCVTAQQVCDSLVTAMAHIDQHDDIALLAVRLEAPHIAVQ